MTDNTEELAACPFCGGEALWYDAEGTKLRPAISCRQCRANMTGGTLDEAIAAWNRRAPGPGYAAGAEAMREAAAVYHDEAADSARMVASNAGAQNDRRANAFHRQLEQEHILCAAAIRALPIPEEVKPKLGTPSVWPNACKHPNSCARHRECMYWGCEHHGFSIADQIDAAG